MGTSEVTENSGSLPKHGLVQAHQWQPNAIERKEMRNRAELSPPLSGRVHSL